MTQEQRARIMAAEYMAILANPPIRAMLQATVSVIPPNIDEIFDQAVETHFGVKIADLDPEALAHARSVVQQARHRMVG